MTNYRQLLHNARKVFMKRKPSNRVLEAVENFKYKAEKMQLSIEDKEAIQERLKKNTLFNEYVKEGNFYKANIQAIGIQASYFENKKLEESGVKPATKEEVEGILKSWGVPATEEERRIKRFAEYLEREMMPVLKENEDKLDEMYKKAKEINLKEND